MRKITLGLIGLLACMALVLPLAAQEGFPLKGSWLGDWGASTTTRTQVFVVFDWDGKTISGSINPGTDMIVIKNASLNPTAVAPPPGTAPAARGGGQAAGAPAAGGAAPAGAPAAGGAAAPAAGGGGRGGRGGGGRGGGGGAAAPAGAPAAGGAAAPAAAAGGGQGGGRGGVGGNTLGGQTGGTLAPAPVEWLVHFEGDGKDSKGAAVHYVVDGKIENIGLYNRSLVGTWVSGATKGTFKLQRQ